MLIRVHLPPELERFTRECVGSGRYNDISEVVRAGLRLLQDAENRRGRFGAMLDKVQADVEHDGTVRLDDALAQVDSIIASRQRPQP